MAVLIFFWPVCVCKHVFFCLGVLLVAGCYGVGVVAASLFASLLCTAVLGAVFQCHSCCWFI